MRKILFASAALVAFAAPASADVTINLTGTIPKSCTIGSGGASEVTAYTLNLGILTLQPTDTLAVACNFTGDATVKLTSTNAGKLVSGTDDIPYSVTTPNGSKSGFSLATPQNVTVPSTSSTLIYVRLNELETRAGTYTDTITATVSP